MFRLAVRGKLASSVLGSGDVGKVDADVGKARGAEPSVAPTRERLVTCAMRLFSTHGYEATSVSRIEAAAGLAVGSGALYHHYKSKEALLEAGIARQLDRRRALADIRALFAGLGNLHAELTVLGRYINTVIAEEAELLQIAARTPAGRSQRLDDAYVALIEGLTSELTHWISTWVPDLPHDNCTLVATLAFNSILGARFAHNLDERPRPLPEDYLKEWTELLVARIEAFNRDHQQSAKSVVIGTAE